MPEITYKFTIDASPAMVFDALTDQQHIAQWWTPDCTVERRVGGHATFEFKGSTGKLDGYALMHIENLLPGKLVVWKCVEQDYQGINDWVGTTVRFRLADNGRGGTDMDFAHLDWKSTEGSYPRCVAGWEHVLLTSLKNYLEIGKGSPYLAHIEKEAAQR